MCAVRITSGANDYSPIQSPARPWYFSPAPKTKGGCSIWSYNLKDNFLSNYSPGRNPCPVNKESALIVSRQTPGGNARIMENQL